MGILAEKRQTIGHREALYVTLGWSPVLYLAIDHISISANVAQGVGHSRHPRGVSACSVAIQVGHLLASFTVT